MRERLPGYQRVLEEYTYQYLLFGYRKPILGHYYAHVLFQASKTFGGITCEVGLSRTEDFPYYRYYDKPELGVAGFRARTTHVVQGLKATTTRLYAGPDVLLGHILEMVSEAIAAGNKLIENSIPRVSAQFRIWQPIYEEWLDAERNARTESKDFRYPSLVGENAARAILHDCLRSGRFDSFLGPKKFRYREPRFLNCHVYLLAKALAFVEPPEPDEMKTLELDPEHNPEKILFDAIGAISGRSEQPEAVELSPEILKRVPEWAFLRAFAALEAMYDSKIISLSEVLASAKPPGSEKNTIKPVGVSLDELYSDTVVSGNHGLTGPPPIPPGTADFYRPPRPKMGKERMDPFEKFGDYIYGRITTKKEPDTFDFLGSQLGL
jgi:hypothetical protein